MQLWLIFDIGERGWGRIDVERSALGVQEENGNDERQRCFDKLSMTTGRYGTTPELPLYLVAPRTRGLVKNMKITKRSQFF